MEKAAKIAGAHGDTPYSGDKLMHCGCSKQIAAAIRAAKETK